MSFCRIAATNGRNFRWDRCDAISVATERERADERARDDALIAGA